jgi:hypothetical protein
MPRLSDGRQIVKMSLTAAEAILISTSGACSFEDAPVLLNARPPDETDPTKLAESIQLGNFAVDQKRNDS